MNVIQIMIKIITDELYGEYDFYDLQKVYNIQLEQLFKLCKANGNAIYNKIVLTGLIDNILSYFCVNKEREKYIEIFKLHSTELFDKKFEWIRVFLIFNDQYLIIKDKEGIVIYDTSLSEVEFNLDELLDSSRKSMDILELLKEEE